MAKITLDLAIGLVRITAGADDWLKLLEDAKLLVPFPQRVEIEIEDPPRVIGLSGFTQSTSDNLSR